MSNSVPTTGSPSSTTVTGRVVEGTNGLFVDVPRRSACQSCGKESGCGMSVLGGLAGSQSMRIELAETIASPGEAVVLSCPQDGLVKAAFIAYAPPALGLVAGAVAVALNGSGDAVQALGALGGMAIGLIFTRVLAASSRLPVMHVLKGANR